MTQVNEQGPDTRHTGWLVLVYRVPSDPSSSRVAIWRDLKRMGALYLQQCVCVVPDRADLRDDIAAVRERVASLGGSSNLFPVPALPADEEAALIAGFRDLSAQQYAEIVEECETKFVKEVEFEHFRENYTFAEAEEIEQDLEKIRRWFARVQARDWFGAPGREEVERWLQRCTELLDEFFAAVHARAADRPDDGQAPGGTLSRLAPVPDATPSAGRGRRRARRA
jgi:hypothetical protein